MKEVLSVCLIQQECIWQDPEQNIDTLENQMSLCENCDLVILPEMWTTGFVMEPQGIAHIENDQYLQRIENLAEIHRVDILGSYSYFNEDKYYNRAILHRKNGSSLIYDKNYLFTLSGEHQIYNTGSRSRAINYYGWSLKIQICYDLRFPESVRDSDMIDLLIYVANWPEQRTNHWRTLLKARAIENQCYTIGCNRIGTDGNGWVFPGNSLVLDYNGEILLEMDEKPSLKIVTLDRSKCLSYRQRLPFQNDKKY